MKSINQELIPNKQVITFEEWENMELEMFFLSVTRGMATAEQKKVCYEQFISDLDEYEIALNNKFFERNNTFELWRDNKLIGLCANEAIARDWNVWAVSTEDVPEDKNKRTSR